MNGTGFYIMIAVAAFILWRRTRSMYRPVRGNGLRILLPLISILPGVSFILELPVSEPVWEYGVALGLGMVLSLPLIWTTNYEVREDNRIYAKKNWGFVAAFVGVVLVRFLLRRELSGMDQQAMMALFMTVAFGYIIPWRIVSFMKFRSVTR